MSWDLIGKFVSRRLAALLVGLFFVDRISNVSPDVRTYAMTAMTVAFIIAQAVENCVLKIKPSDNGQKEPK